jgi:putative peptide zinc metalloprotease protein
VNLMKRMTTALVLAAVALAGAAAPAVAQDNTAIAVNTKDDSSLFKLAFSIKQVSGEVVDNTNAAVAYGNCQSCETVAIAIQVLILQAENPNVVTPTNIAIALNEQCPSCTTVALAYQIVIGRGEPLVLTAEGRREIARIRRELRRLRRAGLGPLELEAQVDALVERLKQVLRTQLVPRGSGDRDDDEDDLEDEDLGLEEPEEDASEREQENLPPPEDQPPQETGPQAPAPEPQPTPEPQPEPAPPPEEGGGTTTTP